MEKVAILSLLMVGLTFGLGFISSRLEPRTRKRTTVVETKATGGTVTPNRAGMTGISFGETASSGKDRRPISD